MNQRTFADNTILEKRKFVHKIMSNWQQKTMNYSLSKPHQTLRDALDSLQHMDSAERIFQAFILLFPRCYRIYRQNVGRMSKHEGYILVTYNNPDRDHLQGSRFSLIVHPLNNTGVWVMTAMFVLSLWSPSVDISTPPIIMDPVSASQSSVKQFQLDKYQSKPNMNAFDYLQGPWIEPVTS